MAVRGGGSGERHVVARIGWLRAAVLGANDGILSVASIIMGVAAAGAPRGAVLLAGLDAPLADAVARQLAERDALGAHLRDELGLTESGAARPVQAALASAASFAVGGAVPMLIALAARVSSLPQAVFAATIVLLAVLGAAGAKAGGAAPLRGAARVSFWGAAAMIVTALIGRLAGVAV